jgi:hypothetical protein
MLAELPDFWLAHGARSVTFLITIAAVVGVPFLIWREWNTDSGHCWERRQSALPEIYRAGNWSPPPLPASGSPSRILEKICFQ